MVAVIVSPGYGAGWSTWNKPHDVFDPKIVKWIEDGMNGDPLSEDDERYGGGLVDAEIVWVPEGTLFAIDEYDGYESITYKEDSSAWTMA